MGKLDSHNGKQTHLYNFLMWNSFHQTVVNDYLKYVIRVCKLDKRAIPKVWAILQANTVKLIKAPQRVLHSVLLTHCNAWCTSSRFGAKWRSCRVCELPFTDDSLAHLACCKKLKVLSFQYLALCSIYDKEAFFLLHDEFDSVINRRAIHLFAAKRAYDISRCKNKFDDFAIHYRSSLLNLFSNGACSKYLSRTLLFGER